jgi:hypothetical protein
VKRRGYSRFYLAKSFAMYSATAPMLWHIVYNTQKPPSPTVAVGEGGFSPYSFQNFSYAFMTVPTNANGVETFKNTTTAVVRVRGLSGGNYWGYPRKAGVADSISEFLGRNFQIVFSGGVKNHIARNILADARLLQRFKTFSFQPRNFSQVSSTSKQSPGTPFTRDSNGRSVGLTIF